MNVEVRNINGVRGFCVYKGGVPYTYIYTRDAMEMLGMTKMSRGKNYVRIDRFIEHFNIAINNTNLNLTSLPVKPGITLTPNFNISMDHRYIGESAATDGRKPNMPEFLLDRIIFAIANSLNNDVAKEFRYRLICDIIPHFQQTATQDQIAKVPILNQTTQFMYDNTNVQFTAQQAYNFNKNIVFQYVNRYAILIGSTNVMNVFENLFTDFEYALNRAGICVQDEIMKVVEARKAVNPYSPDNMTKQDIIDTVICNLRMHNLFTTFIANYIREKEAELLMKKNGEVVKEEWNQGTGYYDTKIGYEDENLKHPVSFVTMDERAGESPIQERSFAKDYLPNQKRDTSWIY